MSDIRDKVVAIIVDKLNVEESEVSNEASFTNDLGADSLDTVELIMEFEKQFNISIPDDKAEGIQTASSPICNLKILPNSLLLLFFRPRWFYLDGRKNGGLARCADAFSDLFTALWKCSLRSKGA